MILGVVSSFVKPVVKLLSIPFIIVTLGLFLLGDQRADAAAHRVARRAARPRVPGRRLLLEALLGALVITLVNWAVDAVVGDERLMPRCRHRASPGRYRIALVCLGNICRSPMAHVVLEARLAEAGLADVVEVTSAGTGGWHEGSPMDERAAATLTAAGYDATRHRARTFDATLARRPRPGAGHGRAPTSRDVGGAGERVALFRDFDPDEPGGEVPDPYYGGTAGFEEVLRMVERTSTSLVAALAAGAVPHDDPAAADRAGAPRSCSARR